MKKDFQLSQFLWNLWCVATVVGIWPRFIEPNILTINNLKLKVPNLPPALKGLKILQFSDLHLNSGLTDYFLKKVRRKIAEASPDIIAFTGDFLCYAKFLEKERLLRFFQSLPVAPFGNYAILGNHDYSEYVCVNEEGDYDTEGDGPVKSNLSKGFTRLIKKLEVSGRSTPRAAQVTLNKELVELVSKTPFKLLHNETVVIPIRGSKLNICGLGEHMIGKVEAEEAYRHYDKNYPGIILVHNPDAIPHLKEYPGEAILCGHTHGGQINLPWMWKRFVVLENIRYKRGLLRENERWIYINKGVGSVMNFRWFSIPELLLLELDSDG